MNDLELKTKLAAELPELIRVVRRPLGTEFIFLDTCWYVTSREWDWIVQEVWYRMSEKNPNIPSEFCNKFHYSRAWQQRAEAYLKAKQS